MPVEVQSCSCACSPQNQQSRTGCAGPTTVGLRLSCAVTLGTYQDDIPQSLHLYPPPQRANGDEGHTPNCGTHTGVCGGGAKRAMSQRHNRRPMLAPARWHEHDGKEGA